MSKRFDVSLAEAFYEANVPQKLVVLVGAVKVLEVMQWQELIVQCGKTKPCARLWQQTRRTLRHADCS